MALVSLVLAAGSASRFGSSKQLINIDGQTLLNRAAEAFNMITPERVVVVLGARFEDIYPTVNGAYHCVYASNWQQGMSASIASGMEYALTEFGAKMTHVAIGLGDQINIRSNNIAKLQTLSQGNQASIIAAKYNNNYGAPAIFPAQYFKSLMALKGLQGAKSVISQNVNNMMSVEMPEALFDIDTIAQLEQWHKCQNNE